ncbi:MAG: NAD(P)H-hydrate dehydratase [Gammaproteobacteria bacterium]|nr:NAD(P)H-hydrate dehydratase [Gammaproteobacteria bacterium]
MVDPADRLYTAEQVRRLDACAIEGHGIPGMDLMERAGRSVFEAARSGFPDARRWLVFCGGGNNGGDGYIVARLAIEAGLDVDVCALKSADGLQGDAALAEHRWRNEGGRPIPWPVNDLDAYELVFDALLGTGLDREPAGIYAEVIDRVNRSPAAVVAVDIPSGLHADSGVALGRAVQADLTVTFIGNKRGLFTADGPDHAGAVRFFDLETPESVRDSEPEAGILVRENIIRENLPRRRRNSHKGSYGWLLGVGSDHGMSGALRLCGEAALRSGAGKVTLVTRSEHAALVNVACPELMVRGMNDAEALEDLLESVDVLVTGTGLGRSDWSERMFRACLKARTPMVIDADGLNLLAEWQAERESWPRDRWVLTPHPAEAGRLLGCSAREVQQDRVGAALRLARQFHAVVTLKGCGTVVADAGGRYAICPLGNPGMATAGTGDVLAGVIAGMLSQGLDPWDAATTGVVAHAAAGDLVAAEQGERGMLASDITGRLPAVLNRDASRA